MFSFVVALNKMKSYKGNIPVSVVIVVAVCACTFAALLYAEKLSSLTSISVLRLVSCSKRDALLSYKVGAGEYRPDDRFEFDPEDCNEVSSGKWVYNPELKSLYSDRTCAYLEKQVTCAKNGRPDSDYRLWEWQPDDCFLPKFNPRVALKKLRGKRLMFVGDSIQRGQWMSFVCMVESIIEKENKSLSRNRSRSHLVFTAKEYNATVEFYWAPFLVESNTDARIISDPNKRILRLDSITKHAKNWKGVDLLVFNSYIWWMSGLKINSLWGSFANEEGYEGLDRVVSYRLALKTWANWLDSNIDTNRTRVFFTTMSPTHLSSADWGNKNGIQCHNETKPAVKITPVWGSNRLSDVVSSIVKKMKIPVTFINITQLSEFRIDGHPSVYSENGGKLLTKKQRADPSRFADCIHWCLPGVPDTWNQIFYAYL